MSRTITEGTARLEQGFRISGHLVDVIEDLAYQFSTARQPDKCQAEVAWARRRLEHAREIAADLELVMQDLYRTMPPQA